MNHGCPPGGRWSQERREGEGKRGRLAAEAPAASEAQQRRPAVRHHWPSPTPRRPPGVTGIQANPSDDAETRQSVCITSTNTAMHSVCELPGCKQPQVGSRVTLEARKALTAPRHPRTCFLGHTMCYFPRTHCVVYDAGSRKGMSKPQVLTGGVKERPAWMHSQEVKMEPAAGARGYLKVHQSR